MSIDKKMDGAFEDGQSAAAEYVLGLLDAEQHAQFSLALADDAALQKEVTFWQTNFAQLNDEFVAVQPPRSVFKAISDRLYGAPKTTNWRGALWNSVAVWRGFALATFLIAVIGISSAVFMQTQMPESTEQLVATLENQDSDVRFLALYDKQAGGVRLTSVSGSAVEGRDLELWLIDGAEAPISIGLLPVTGQTFIALSDANNDRMRKGVTLAITLEPLGGAPGGIPSGPIVSVGQITLI